MALTFFCFEQYSNISCLTTLETPNCIIIYYFNVYFNIHKFELFAHKIYVLMRYRGADKSLARPGRKQATETEDFDFHISYL
jgi:hypothetical protein